MRRYQGDLDAVGISGYRVNRSGLVIYVALVHGENLPLLAFSKPRDCAASIATSVPTEFYLFGAKAISVFSIFCERQNQCQRLLSKGRNQKQ